MDNELSKGFTGVEINGVCFSNIGEMLRYMDKQRKQLTKAKDLIDKLLHCGFILPCYKKDAIIVEAEQFLKDLEK